MAGTKDHRRKDDRHNHIKGLWPAFTFLKQTPRQPNQKGHQAPSQQDLLSKAAIEKTRDMRQEIIELLSSSNELRRKEWLCDYPTDDNGDARREPGQNARNYLRFQCSEEIIATRYCLGGRSVQVYPL